MQMDLSRYDGPRTPTEEEGPAVGELARRVFFPDASSYLDAGHTWPMALRTKIREDCLAMFHDGAPVSTIQRLVRDILVDGHRLRLCYIGGVCTDPEHRGKGLAGAILAAMLDQARREDIDFAYISGSRRLYLATGADHAALATCYRLTAATLGDAGPAVAPRPAGIEDAATLAALAQAEAVRFVRPLQDFELTLAHGHCGGRPCRFDLVEVDGVPVAYLLLGEQGRGGNGVEVLEVAGERLALRAALAALARRAGPGESVLVDLPHGGRLGALLVAAGAAAEPGKSGGTIKALDFAGTLTRLAPYFQERLPGWTERELEAVAGMGRYVAWNDGGSLQVDGESEMLWTLLGRPSDAPPGSARATGQFEQLLRRCLPLPLPPLHLNLI